MKIYLDTSVIVAALTNEAKTAVVHAWLADRQSDDLTISEWVVTEFSAALSIKRRTGQIDAAGRTSALSAFARLSMENLSVIAVSQAHFRAAARFADHYAAGLRAGDALHLAICADRGAVLNTLDHRLSEAGPDLGIVTALL